MDGDEEEDTLTTEEYIVVNFKELNLEKERYCGSILQE